VKTVTVGIDQIKDAELLNGFQATHVREAQVTVSFGVAGAD
tara:strand:- start:237 stop:359 length:123 start_codon:yes stop_codon:yes gene_type:complete